MAQDDILPDRPLLERFFRPIDWIAFWVASAAAFCVYIYTLAPTVTMEDCGELSVAGDWAGVPHPPGYPVWTMAAWVFARLFSFVTFRGQPNPAWSIGFMSVVFGALATGLTSMLICRSGSHMIRRLWQESEIVNEARLQAICCVSGIAASLLFALTPAMWSQAVIVEVYTMNAFFMILMFLLTYKWIYQPSDRLLYTIGFIFGISVAHYYTLMLTALPLIIVVFLKDLRLFRDGSIVLIPYGIGFGLWMIGVIPDIPSLDSGIGITYLVLNFLVIGLAYFLLPRGKTIATGILLAQLGVAFYVYMPLASDLRNPPINWGYPRTWQGFLHAVSRGQYEKFTPGDMFSLEFLDQLGFYLSDVRLQFALLPGLVGFLSFTNWKLKIRNFTIHALPLAIVLVLLTVAIDFVETLPPGAQEGSLFKWIALLVGVVAAFGGFTLLVGQVINMALQLVGLKDSVPVSQRFGIGLVLLIVFCMYIFWWVPQLTSKLVLITEPLRQAGVSFQPGQLNTMFWQGLGIILLAILPVILTILIIWLKREPNGLELTVDDNSQKWIIATLVNFAMLSMMLIFIANPKGDIQDNFIQKVKFITSHNIYSLWIGYGLIFGLFFVDRIFRGNTMAATIVLALVLGLPLVPILRNQYDHELQRVYGGSEQNGHDFGWQFGNYQLRGAQAINEELDPEEEPLPNPQFPPDMTPNAIFFGGTDPGRFVPTYMIYSARVREDVYLITQNALADNTYMSVMRDLYGDRIWIPSSAESAGAFQRYVREVQTGKRPKNADLRIEGNRVQVSGALGVMEINGILCQMIFEHNSFRQDHYVEESYVIPWMYPYLTPHGLIMKINRTSMPTLSAEVVQDDLDFWDWYTRRFIGNDKFIRDVVARKSFSKLRSAIGGLYANRGMFFEAEAAFQEARLLYPLSPEANFRLIQEVLVRMSRYPESRRISEEFQKEDPNNKKVDSLISQLSSIENLNIRVMQMEKELQSQPQVDANKALELAKLYQDAARFQQFMMLAAQILNNTNLPSVYHFRLAQMYANVRRTTEMVAALNLSMRDLPPNLKPEVYLEIARLWALAQETDPSAMEKMLILIQLYLKQKPNDWRARLDLASIQISLNKPEDARLSLREAVRYGGMEAQALITQNPRLAGYYRAPPAPNGGLGLPGLPDFQRPPPRALPPGHPAPPR